MRGMTARPRPPHNRTGGFRKGGEQSQSCGVRHRPRSIRHPPASADRSVGHRSRPAKAHGGGWKSGEGGTAQSWTVLRRSGGDRKIERVWGVGGRALPCHNNTTPASGDTLALGCSARP
ncbi:unnamed protein product [Pleuronectes platessa]|uniref:Uncharacterized protein n=1 Tax=Pleuronectes platessa TaxID=8262 RepID=A0A9N7TXT8_PLEPL|nr:unnamed protein product [Pleuronectes platessa]